MFVVLRHHEKKKKKKDTMVCRGFFFSALSLTDKQKTLRYLMCTSW